MDSDDDGVPDNIEAGDSTLDTPPVDSDGDGRPDFRDTDSDNGGVTDGVEVNEHDSDRLDPSDDGVGWPEPGSEVSGGQAGCRHAPVGSTLWPLYLCLFALGARRMK